MVQAEESRSPKPDSAFGVRKLGLAAAVCGSFIRASLYNLCKLAQHSLLFESLHPVKQVGEMIVQFHLGGSRFPECGTCQLSQNPRPSVLTTAHLCGVKVFAKEKFIVFNNFTFFTWW